MPDKAKGGPPSCRFCQFVKICRRFRLCLPISNRGCRALESGRRQWFVQFPRLLPSSSIPSRKSVRGAMKLNLLSPQAWLLLLGCAAICSSSVGCQTTIGGQTLPSAYYLKDDLQYFPPGPEFKLTRQVQALEEYRLRQEGGAPGEQP